MLTARFIISLCLDTWSHSKLCLSNQKTLILQSTDHWVGVNLLDQPDFNILPSWSRLNVGLSSVLRLYLLVNLLHCTVYLYINSCLCDGLAYAYSRVEYTQPWLLFTPSITQKQKKAWSTGYHCDQTNSIISPVLQENQDKKGSNIEHKTAQSTITSDSKIQQVIFQTISKLPLSIDLRY